MDDISFDDFCKVDIRIGKVLTAEEVLKSKKLIKLQVDFGEFQRQILAGVKEHFQPETLINQHFCFVVNLTPKQIMGFESHGMILAAKSNTGELLIPSLGLDDNDSDFNGAKVK